MRGKNGNRRPNPRLMSLSKAPKDHVHVGLCLLYCGSAFRGLQLQAHSPTCHTVEGVLIQALKDAHLVADVVRGRPEGDQHHFARACRTDRGVHAIRNIISLFIAKDALASAGGLEGVCAQVNQCLPAMVRVAHAMLLAGNFMPRHCCNRRVYRYMLPLYALLPPCDTWAALETYYPGCLAQLQDLAVASTAAQRTLHGVPFVDVEQLLTAVAAPASTSPVRSWVRDTQAKVAFCNRILADQFTGSRRYHNFSVDVDSNRSSVSAKVVQPDTDEALRVIYRCEIFPRIFFFPCATCAEGGSLQPCHGASLREYLENMRTGANTQTNPPCSPIPTSSTAALPAGVTVLPFFFFQVEGGSFLLNMIRKMVGSLLAVCRGARPSILDEAFSPAHRVTTPLAPGPYLYLAQSTYHGYDRSLGGLQGTRLPTVQEAWAGAVDDAAEAFAFHDIAADIVDADLNALPPLDDCLAARDAALAVRRPHTAVEDAHLCEMKEYKAVLPSRTAWPACGEMTIFLRLLRVHNWNVRPIRLDPNCKALKEVRNREERAAAAAAAVAAAASEEASASVKATAPDGESAEAEAEVPEGGTDGWLYRADSAEEAAAQQQAYFASRWKRARPWEFAKAETDVGGEDDVDDEDNDVVTLPRRQPRR